MVVFSAQPDAGGTSRATVTVPRFGPGVTRVMLHAVRRLTRRTAALRRSAAALTLLVRLGWTTLRVTPQRCTIPSGTVWSWPVGLRESFDDALALVGSARVHRLSEAPVRSVQPGGETT